MSTGTPDVRRGAGLALVPVAGAVLDASATLSTLEEHDDGLDAQDPGHMDA